MSQSPRPAEASLAGISASSARDIWAVGRRDSGALMEHWDGARWRIVDAPRAASTPAWAVAALSTSNAWVMGGSLGRMRGVRLRWDGRRWSAVPTRMFAWDVAASGARAWAVGVQAGRPHIERWDGRSWYAVAPPTGMPTRLRSAAGGDLLQAVTVAGSEAWVVGRAYDRRAAASAVTFASRWDGRQWRYVPTPNVSLAESASNAFSAVSGSSRTDVWAVGFWEDPGADRGGSLIEHWNGRAWKVVPSVPGAPCGARMGSCTASDSLYGVAAIGPADAWAVGARPQPIIDENGELLDYEHRPLIAHWDGRRWRVVPFAGTGRLTDVIAVSNTNV